LRSQRAERILGDDDEQARRGDEAQWQVDEHGQQDHAPAEHPDDTGQQEL